MNDRNLTELGAATFQHLVNELALRVLGPGLTLFGEGPDGGRDAYFRGSAPYPSLVENWSGVWYVQSKYHSFSHSDDEQKWLLSRIESELKEFSKSKTKRVWPDIWIIATNVNPSAVSETGTFDQAVSLVKSYRPELVNRFHIWGRAKLLAFLGEHTTVAERYGHFLTPGQVLSEIHRKLEENTASPDTILRYLTAVELDGQQYAALDQARGNPGRPGVHDIFVDLPFRTDAGPSRACICEAIALASARNLRPTSAVERIFDNGIWFIKGGPGQGKSTIVQYLAQVNRAALILSTTTQVHADTLALAERIRDSAVTNDLWPSIPRMPIVVQLKVYAKWMSDVGEKEPHGILTYLAHWLYVGTESAVSAGQVHRALQHGRWLVVLDGLDEVPSDIKDAICGEIKKFVKSVNLVSDILVVFTSRPQGYFGQLKELGGRTVELYQLSRQRAFECAARVTDFYSAGSERATRREELKEAIEATIVADLMVSPLQAHIIAVIICGGRRPPQRRWELYNTFYNVICDREIAKGYPKHICSLLREEPKLVRAIHSALGFSLHADSESAQGASATMDRLRFRALVADVVMRFKGEVRQELVDSLMLAVTERLVLITTPESSSHVRFDLRQLQEFFAAEFIYLDVEPDQLRERLLRVAPDSHWREVAIFLVSALVECNRRAELLEVCSALDDIENGPGEETQRLLYQRWGRGHLLMTKILQDGVLEQDLAMRRLFRSAVANLARCRNDEILRKIAEVRGRDSKTWLLDVFLDQLLHRTVWETTGASSVIWRLLEDGDPRSELVLTKWRADDYQGFIDALELSGYRSSEENFSKWQVSAAVEFLRNHKANTSSTERFRQSVNMVIRVLTHNESSIDIACEHFGTWAKEFFSLFDRRPLVEQQRDLGFMSQVAEIYPPVPFAMEEILAGLCSESSPFFEVNSKLLKFLIIPSLEALRELLRLTEWADLDFAPAILRGRVESLTRSMSPSEAMSELLRKSDLSLGGLIETDSEQPVTNLALTFKDSSNELLETVDNFRELASISVRFAIWQFHSVNDGENGFFSVPENIKQCADIMRITTNSSPFWLRHFDPYLWPTLFTDPTFRDQVNTAFSLTQDFDVHLVLGSCDWQPVELNLPFESWLLVPLAEAVALYDEKDGLSDTFTQKGRFRACQRIVAQSVVHIGQLRSLASSADVPLRVRVAAVLLASIHPDGGIDDLLNHRELLLDATSKGIPTCLCVPATVSIAGCWDNEDVLELAGTLLARTPVGGPLVNGWDLAFMMLREDSSSPVTREGLKESWWRDWMNS